MSGNFSKAQQTAQIILLEGMKKGFLQTIEQLQHNIEKVEDRLEEVRGTAADE